MTTIKFYVGWNNHHMLEASMCKYHNIALILIYWYIC